MPRSDAPDKLKELITLATEKRRPDLLSLRESKSTYMLPVEKLNFLKALSLIETFITIWTPYRDSFKAEKGPGEHPRRDSYAADLDTLKHFVIKDNKPLSDYKKEYLIKYIVPENKWHIFGIDNAIIDQQSPEKLNDFRGRIRTFIKLTLTKNCKWLYETLGVNGPTRTWNGQVNPYNITIHTSIKRIMNATTWRIDSVSGRDDAINHILGNRDNGGLHATLEIYGSDSPQNPKRFKGEKTNHPFANEWGRMNGVWENRKAKIEDAINNKGIALSGALVQNWEFHV